MSNFIRQAWRKDASISDTDFVYFGSDMLNSESMTDKIYETFLGLLVKQFEGDRASRISDIGNIYKNGVYLPCVERVSFSNTIDVGSGDRVKGGTYYDSLHKTFSSASPVHRFPNGIVSVVKGQKIKYIAVESNNDKISATSFFLTLTKNGDIFHTKNTHEIDSSADAGAARVSASATVWASVTIAALSDSDYLWSAKIYEDIIGSKPVEVALGMGLEEIKSLFYARSLPLTETGRKRPILHLVRAHQRRIKEGIDIDIDRHIRGVDRVSIDGFEFNLRPPIIDSDLHRRWAA